MSCTKKTKNAFFLKLYKSGIDDMSGIKKAKNVHRKSEGKNGLLILYRGEILVLAVVTS
jgi:hypothetical protein